MIMEKLKTPLILLSCCFTFLLSSAIFTPTDNYLLNCGSTTTTTIDNRNFLSELSSNLVSSVCFPESRSVSLIDPNPSPSSSPLYHTARVFTRPSNYVFKINHRGTYVVRLHFSPFQSAKFDLFNALFHVSVNEVLLLRDFTPKRDSKLPIKEYLIWVSKEELVISFTPKTGSNFAFVNAIEVFTAPEDLIADTAKFVNEKGVKDVFGLRKQAFETLYRVNVGGPKVTPFNDTLWRTWVPDDGVFKLSPNSRMVHFSGRIKYQKGGLSREIGPDNVYSSARLLNASSNDMTWSVDVSSGYRYLVRMHFCDIASLALYQMYFNVYVNGYLAVEELDLSTLANGMLASPYYADFIVDGHNSGILSVGVGPTTRNSGELKFKAILNGLEIMKMNNSVGSLDGEMSVDSVLKSSPTGNMGVLLLPLVGIMGLVTAGMMLISRKRILEKDSVKWSRLAVDPLEGGLKQNDLSSTSKLVNA